MTRKALGLTAAALMLGALVTVVVAQVRRPAPPAQPQTPAQLALRALFEGRFDEVASITGKDGFDPTLVAIRARALSERGNYKEAEEVLRPVVQRQPVSDAALELGLLLKMLSRAEGTQILERVAAAADTASRATELSRSARALQALGRYSEANAAFRDAATAAPRDINIQTAWGEMELEADCETCNADAAKAFEAVLKEDPRWIPALVGMGRALSNDNPPEAVANFKKALEINGASVPALLRMASDAMDTRRAEARTLLGKVFEVNPNNLDAHALMASIAYVEDKASEFDEHVKAALALSPNLGEVYRAAGELAAYNYRYDEAVVLVRKGLALDPQNHRSLTDLGTHLLRTGDEAGARTALDQSFKLHPYDVITKNLLDMMDRLDTFVTIRDGDLVIRMDKGDAAVMQDSVVGLAKQALSTFSQKYQFTPKGPILIEIFPKHDDFAVRNVGLPGMIGALGACFGRVVTMDSPKARPPGDFQWEATLWHELAHVITLQMSNQRVPRWLTEGISEYEEKVARPDWARGMDLEYAARLNRGETLTLENLNSGFRDGRTIGLAYFQASLLVDHIVATYGDEGLRKLLRAYAQGLETNEAMRTAVGATLGEMQGAFDRRMEEKYGKIRAALKDPPKDMNLARMPLEELKLYASKNEDSYIAQMSLGMQLVRAADFDGAVTAFTKAKALVPIATGDDSPYAQLALIALRRKDTAAAIEALREQVGVDFNNIDAARQLASLMRDQNITDPARLAPIYERVVSIDPFDADTRTAYGRVLMKQNKADAAVREFKAVVAMNPVDQAAAQTDLAEGYFLSGKRSDARRHTLAALEVAPSYERAQDLLLKIAEARP